MTTLQSAIRAVQAITAQKPSKNTSKIADRLLGKFKGVLPKGRSSSEIIRDLRNSSYGKIT